MVSTDYPSQTITVEQAAHFVEEVYGIKGEVNPLDGEVDFNFKITSDTGSAYTLKISRKGITEQELDFQEKIMSHLGRQNIPIHIPIPVASKEGKMYETVQDEAGDDRWIRLQTWVAGEMMGNVNPLTADLLNSWGKACGYLSKGLESFDHAAAHKVYKWDPSEVLHTKKYFSYLLKRSERELVTYFWDLIEKEGHPLLSSLRKGVNYNDAHMHNILVHGRGEAPEVAGIIDFGDAVYTHTVNELAIACAYACMGKEDPLATAKEVVKGYHEVYALQRPEVEVLYYQIASRLILTVMHASVNAQLEPENEYLQVSSKPAWNLLRKWKKISPRFAYISFCESCHADPFPTRKIYDTWLEGYKHQLSPVVQLAGKTVTYLDLSVGSKALGNNQNFENIENFDRCIRRMLEDLEVDIGLGGYGEVRPFYTTDAYEVEGNEGLQWRTEHIGYDIWAPAGTAVRAPLDGKIFSFKNNEAERDYGPTIILKHEVTEELTFYTLYGHLSEESLEGLICGQQVSKGSEFARIGEYPENGNWPAHLHFQVMLDLLGFKGDFPGVAYPHESHLWKLICPTPIPFIHADIPEQVHSQLGSAQIREKRNRYMGKSLSLTYDRPLHMVRGYKQYLYDASGRRFMDMVNNVAHVGHEHPAVVAAAKRQLSLLNTNTRYLHEEIVCFAEELQEMFPEELSVVYFVNSGSEANELALRMAHSWSGQRDMLALEVGYHGNTVGTVDISSYKFDGKGGKGVPPHTHVIPIPDMFRGMCRNSEEAGTRYAAKAKELIHKVQKEGRNMAGFIAESIMSCGGQVPLPRNFLEEVYTAVRKAGGVCIADEVQTGFGRVGEHFWSFQLYNVVPDIVTMGKPIGNGHPLGAVITRPEIAEAFSNGMEYFNTFGGNPVSCSVGRQVLRVVKEENLQQHALEMGNYLQKGLKDLQPSFPIIGDVRGHGLFLGFELVKDPETLTPAAEEATYLANRMREKGILMSTDGPLHNVLKIKPPMCFSQRNADQFLDYLGRVLKEDKMRG